MQGLCMFMSVNVSVFVNVNEFGHWVCGESWSLTHRPSSQGWAPCVLLFCCLFVCFMGWEFLGFLSPPFCLFASVLYNSMSLCHNNNMP